MVETVSGAEAQAASTISCPTVGYSPEGRAYSSAIRGLESTKSAVARLHAVGTL